MGPTDANDSSHRNTGGGRSAVGSSTAVRRCCALALRDRVLVVGHALRVEAAVGIARPDQRGGLGAAGIVIRWAALAENRKLK